MLDMNRLAGQGPSALEVSGQSIPKCSKNNKNNLLNIMLEACRPHWDNVHPVPGSSTSRSEGGANRISLVADSEVALFCVNGILAQRGVIAP